MRVSFLIKLQAWDTNRPYPLEFFKGCFPQILLDPFLNALTHMLVPSKCLVASLDLLFLSMLSFVKTIKTIHRSFNGMTWLLILCSCNSFTVQSKVISITWRSNNLVPNTSAGETENINFIECCVSWVKNSIYPVTNTGVEFLIHNHPFFTHLLRG